MTDSPPELDPSLENNSEWKYDLLIDSLFAIGVAFNIYMIVDVATDGQLSRDMATAMQRWKAGLLTLIHRQAVLDEAHEALYIEKENDE